jgi:L-ribulose-5-phosphate 3-epimerase
MAPRIVPDRRSAMFLGYNTNGFAHHRLDDAISILADLGYGGVALTLDVQHLDPFAPQLLWRIAEVRNRLERHGMKCAIETGARFLLDPVRKHQPTLLSPSDVERNTRLDFLKRSIAIAVELNAGCVSFWSGAAGDDASHEELMRRLVDGVQRLIEQVEGTNVVLAFEPEPGMFIDTINKFSELHKRVNHPSFGLTCDIGHLVCNDELPVSKFLAEWKYILWNVHIEDMRRGIHDHLMIGEGEVDFGDVFSGLKNANYAGGLYVELSRHSYDAVQTARKTKAILDRYIGVK